MRFVRFFLLYPQLSITNVWFLYARKKKNKEQNFLRFICVVITFSTSYGYGMVWSVEQSFHHEQYDIDTPSILSHILDRKMLLFSVHRFVFVLWLDKLTTLKFSLFCTIWRKDLNDFLKLKIKMKWFYISLRNNYKMKNTLEN